MVVSWMPTDALLGQLRREALPTDQIHVVFSADPDDPAELVTRVLKRKEQARADGRAALAAALALDDFDRLGELWIGFRVPQGDAVVRAEADFDVRLEAALQILALFVDLAADVAAAREVVARDRDLRARAVIFALEPSIRLNTFWTLALP